MFRERFRAFVVLVLFGVSLAVYPLLPVALPPGWPDAAGLGPRACRLLLAFFLPFTAAAVAALFQRLAAADRRRSEARFGPTFELLLDAAVVLIAGLHLVLLATLLGAPPAIGTLPPLLIGLLLVAVGNVLPRLRPNAVVGVRTPWTLADAGVWSRTHRLGGYLTVALGLAVLAATAFAPRWLAPLVGLGTILVVVILVVFSYRAARRAPPSKEGGS